MSTKPRCLVPECHGNIMAIEAGVLYHLRKNGLEEEAKELEERLKEPHSYNKGLLLCAKYIDFEV